MPTRIVLHSRQRHMFVCKDASWSLSAAEALQFFDAQSAVDFAREHCLSGVEIVVERDEEPMFRIPLRNFGSAQD